MKKFKFNGVRKLECTYNIKENSYHPHFHIIIDNLDVANYIRLRWLARWPDAAPWCQDVKPIELNQRSGVLMEVFKYSTKFHSTFINENGDKETGISCYHLDIIFRCLYRVRTYQPFGNIKKVCEELTDLQAEEYEGLVKRKTEWSWDTQDWFNIDDGECLTWYEPTEKDIELREAIKLVQSIDKKTISKITE